MNKLLIQRLLSDDKSTLGILSLNFKPICCTLENPQSQFLIPAGKYICKRVISNKFGETFTIEGVKNHSLLRFHWGNTEKDTDGCVITGMCFAPKDSDLDVLYSRNAFFLLLNTLKGINELPLAIENIF